MANGHVTKAYWSFMLPFNEPIRVCKPALPRFEDFCDELSKVWKSAWLTNDGPVSQRLRVSLQTLLGTNNVSIYSNGTLALQGGLHALGCKGSVITTPFTFVATVHSLILAGIRPIFCDIDPDTGNIDADKVEELIEPDTSCIMPVHVYGNPCDVHRLDAIGKKKGLSVFYDAAQAFGAKVDGIDISLFGDMSMVSFHATKIVHTLEGGMLVFRNAALRSCLDQYKNFGFVSEEEVACVGTNAKMNEIQSLVGEFLVSELDVFVEHGRRICSAYQEALMDLPGIRFCSVQHHNVEPNFSYAPVQILDEFGLSRDELYRELKKFNVFARKYFFPLVSEFSCYKDKYNNQDTPVAHDFSNRALVLPNYYDLAVDDVLRICEIIKYIRKKRV